MRSICEVEGCDRRVNTRGLCSMHHLRMKRRGSLNPPPITGPSVEQRLRAGHSVDPVSGCWRFHGVSVSTGYGVLSIDNRPRLAHRVAYELWVGPIPEGFHIDHVRARGCVHRNCINPAHLEPVTPRENVRRALAGKPQCRRGHAFTPENTYVDAQGRRRCRECHRAKTRESRQRRTKTEAEA